MQDVGSVGLYTTFTELRHVSTCCMPSIRCRVWYIMDGYKVLRECKDTKCARNGSVYTTLIKLDYILFQCKYLNTPSITYITLQPSQHGDSDSPPKSA